MLWLNGIEQNNVQKKIIWVNKWGTSLLGISLDKVISAHWISNHLNSKCMEWMKRICWEGGMITLGAAGGVIVQVFHGGPADFHGEDCRDVMLKVWAAHWSPWPSIMCSLTLQRWERPLQSLSPGGVCVVFFSDTLQGQAGDCSPTDQLVKRGTLQQLQAVSQVKERVHTEEKLLSYEGEKCAANALFYERAAGTLPSTWLLEGLSLPGCSSTRKSWVAALWTLPKWASCMPWCQWSMQNSAWRHGTLCNVWKNTALTEEASEINNVSKHQHKRVSAEAEVQGTQAKDCYFSCYHWYIFWVLLNLGVHYHPGSWSILQKLCLPMRGTEREEMLFSNCWGVIIQSMESETPTLETA